MCLLGESNTDHDKAVWVLVMVDQTCNESKIHKILILVPLWGSAILGPNPASRISFPLNKLTT